MHSSSLHNNKISSQFTLNCVLDRARRQLSYCPQSTRRHHVCFIATLHQQSQRRNSPSTRILSRSPSISIAQHCRDCRSVFRLAWRSTPLPGLRHPCAAYILRAPQLHRSFSHAVSRPQLDSDSSLDCPQASSTINSSSTRTLHYVVSASSTCQGGAASSDEVVAHDESE
jgi:hypothetical protein